MKKDQKIILIVHNKYLCTHCLRTKDVYKTIINVISIPLNIEQITKQSTVVIIVRFYCDVSFFTPVINVLVTILHCL